MNLIEHLNRTVTPILLGNQAENNDNQQSLLERVYAIFIARLADQEAYQSLENSQADAEDSSFVDRLIPDSTHTIGMVQELSKEYHISEEETATLITRSAPLVFNELRGLAGDKSLPSFLADNLSSVGSLLPHWAYAFIPVGILSGLNLSSLGQAGADIVNNTVNTVSEGVTTAVSQAKDTVANAKDSVADAVSSVNDTVSNAVSSASNNEETGGLGRVLLPLIALLIIGAMIAMMLKSCNNNKTATTPSVPVASVASATATTGSSLLAPTLKFATTQDGKLLDGGLGVVGDEALKGKILGALSGVFGDGADKAVNVSVNPAHDINLPFTDKLGEIFALLKGVPNASFDYVDGHIMISAPDEAVAKKLVADIQALVPNTHVMLASDHAHHEHEHGHEHHDHSHAHEHASVATADNKSAEASVEFADGHLNFYFATGKADVAPNAIEHAKVILDEAKAGKKLGISGYTDSTGNAEANAKLSKKRAEAVKKFLMDNGVAETQLELIKPKDTVGATGKDQEGRRVEVYVVEDTASASTAQ